MSDDDTTTNLPQLQDDSNDQLSGMSGVSSVPLDDNQLPVQPVSDSAVSQHAKISSPIDAADSDLIEKEWVVKAKQIVEQTVNDPHAQQQEIAKMKTEYIKKRYKRDIEL
jgi:hypothetical protein